MRYSELSSNFPHCVILKFHLRSFSKSAESFRSHTPRVVLVQQFPCMGRPREVIYRGDPETLCEDRKPYQRLSLRFKATEQLPLPISILIGEFVEHLRHPSVLHHKSPCFETTWTRMVEGSL